MTERLTGWWQPESDREITQRQFAEMREALQDATNKGKAVVVAAGVRLVWHPAPESLDAAWAAVEAALPEGWRLHFLEASGTQWRAVAANQRDDGTDPFIAIREAATPAAALQALASALRATTKETEE